MMKNMTQKNRGFSLVETLVAISILMISIAGPMVLVGNGIRSSAFARDQITAFYLAQDAIEGLRYVRDGNRIAKVLSSDPDSVAWDDLTEDYTCTVGNPCGIDTDRLHNGEFNAIANSTADDYLRIDGQGKYGYDTLGTPTIFKRSIVIEEVEEDKEVEVTVTVDWSSGIYNRTFKVRENLFFWY